MIQQARMKYAWDITSEREFSERELSAINKISDTISNGGSVIELKKKMRFVEVLLE
jgi:hypothetical protein